MTHIVPYSESTVKIILKIQDGGSRHLENHKNRDISVAVWPIFTKFGTLMQNGFLTALAVKNFEFHKSKMADGRHFKNR